MVVGLERGIRCAPTWYENIGIKIQCITGINRIGIGFPNFISGFQSQYLFIFYFRVLPLLGLTLPLNGCCLPIVP